MSEALNNFIGFFERGGLFMWPLLICSMVALTTIIAWIRFAGKERDAAGDRK